MSGYLFKCSALWVKDGPGNLEKLVLELLCPAGFLVSFMPL